MYVNFLSTYSDKKFCHTSTTLQTSIARFVSDSSASCFYQSTGRSKRTEQNLIVRVGRSEAEVTNNKRPRSRYCRLQLKLTTNGHKASRGLSVTAEFLVTLEVSLMTAENTKAETDDKSLLPRDAMHKRGLCRHAVSVCLSVCLSVCHVRELRQNE